MGKPGLILLLGLALAFAPAASAQSATAPEPSETNNVLYVHHNSSDTQEINGWMNAQQDDGDDTAMGPSASCNNNPTGVQAIPFTEVEDVDDEAWGADIDRTYTIVLQPGLLRSLHLEEGQPVKATIHFGAGSCGGHPHITSTLSVGSTEIAKGEADHSYYPGAPYPSVAIDMAVASTIIPTSDPLVWTIQVVGTYYGAGFLGVGEPQGRSQLLLPIGSAPVPSTTSTNSSTSTSSGSTETNSSTSSSSVSSSSSTLSSSSSSSASTSANGTDTSSPSKDSPSVALPLLMAGIALAVAVRRRLR